MGASPPTFRKHVDRVTTLKIIETAVSHPRMDRKAMQAGEIGPGNGEGSVLRLLRERLRIGGIKGHNKNQKGGWYSRHRAKACKQGDGAHL